MIANRRVEDKRAPLLEPPRGTYERAAKARLDMTISEQEVSKYSNAPREKEYRALRKKYGERPVTRESRLEPETILNLTSWRRALTEDLPCGMIHPRDAVALLYFPAPNATFRCKARESGEKTKNRDFTVAALCGHITLLNDPHPLCVAGQVLATGTLCCVDNSTVCDIGWADDKVNGNAYERWRKNRYSTLRRWMNEGSDVTTNMLGPTLNVVTRPRSPLDQACL